MIFKIGFSKKESCYYLWDKENIFCFLCRKKQAESFLLRTEMNPLLREIEQKSYCVQCDEATKNSFKHGTRTMVLIEKKPKDCIPVIPDTLIAKSGEAANKITGGTILSSEDIAADKKAGVHYEDHTRLADRESWEGATIGAEPTERIAELDKPLLNDKHGLKYLQNLMDAEIVQPEIENKSRKQLEHK